MEAKCKYFLTILTLIVCFTIFIIPSVNSAPDDKILGIARDITNRNIIFNDTWVDHPANIKLSDLLWALQNNKKPEFDGLATLAAIDGLSIDLDDKNTPRLIEYMNNDSSASRILLNCLCFRARAGKGQVFSDSIKNALIKIVRQKRLSSDGKVAMSGLECTSIANVKVDYTEEELGYWINNTESESIYPLLDVIRNRASISYTTAMKALDAGLSHDIGIVLGKL